MNIVLMRENNDQISESSSCSKIKKLSRDDNPDATI